MFNESISERMREVLYAVVHNYILTAAPTGSIVLTKKYDINLSPASVRNIMAELEEMGHLTHPHTSAGRIPTDKGFRFYVDTLVQLKCLNKEERDEIKEQYSSCLVETRELMEKTSGILSILSHYMGVVLVPRFPSITIKKMELIRLGPKQVLVVLISVSGIVNNNIVEMEEEVCQSDLDRMCKYLNGIVANLTLPEVRQKVLEEMENEKNYYDKLLNQALKIGAAAIKDVESKDDIFIKGRVNIIEQPEFSNIEMMKNLFNAFEEKNTLIKILDKSLEADGIQIIIGSESNVSEIKEYSIITAPYKMKDSVMGTLGVVGPKRMDYAKVIPIVDYTATLVGGMLERKSEHY